MIFFPDTNFFLHYIDASECAWGDITRDQEICLVICRTIQRELDKKKHESKGRARKRARKYAALIGKIVVSSKPKVLRPSRPRVLMELSPEWPNNWTPPAGLDVDGSMDDCFIADVLAFQANSDQDCRVLTADTGVLATARSRHIDVSFLLDTDWELAEETDTRDKRIKGLEREVKALKTHGPIIEVCATHNGDECDQISIHVVRISSLTDEQIEDLTSELYLQYPEVTDFSKPPDRPVISSGGFNFAQLADSFEWQAPTEQEITEYSQSYAEWLESARRHIEEIPAVLQQPTFESFVELSLSNNGTRPAEELLISFETTPGITLRSADDADEQVIDEGDEPTIPAQIPHPPDPPAWRKVYQTTSADGLTSPFDHLDHSVTAHLMRQINDAARSVTPYALDDLLAFNSTENYLGIDRSLLESRPSFDFDTFASRLPQPRDPNTFYWKTNQAHTPSDHMQFECSEFRHLDQPETWRIAVSVAYDDLPSNGGVIEIEVHARNLPKPYRHQIPVRITVEEQDTEQIVRSLIRPPTPDEF